MINMSKPFITNDDIPLIKRRISDRFLGKHNIHGVGVDENCIVIYASKQLPPLVIQEIKDMIDPICMTIKICQQPKIV